MERRKFIKSTVAVSLVPALLNSCTKTKGSDPKDQKISGFIFSDAHIGWDGKEQPTLKQQQQAIGRIKNFFNHIDLVFDTGDIHHGNLREPQRQLARKFWLAEMAGQFPDSIFHYVPGNHELGRGLNDAELTVCKLGSMALRPYYSFDYKGIHFVSLPQLLDTILISEETVNWFEQDLRINADKTTLIFSHNSISGTTFTNGESGYRETVNSEKILEIMDMHGQVLAWFHGHNHQYEVVNKHNRLYVSNGRIGGFNPPEKWGEFGQGHLGGVSFTIDENGIEVRCFSASSNEYFDQIGFENLSHKLNVPTTYNPQSPMNYYCGHGRLTNSVKHELHNHYLSKMKAVLVFNQNKAASINENNSFKYKSAFYFAGRNVHRVIGFQVSPKKTKFDVKKHGLEIYPVTQKKEISIKFPVEKYKFKKYLSRSGYYRCALGETFQLTLNLLEAGLESQLLVSYKLMSESHEDLFESKIIPMQVVVKKDINTIIKLPSVLTGVDVDKKLYIFVTVSFKNVKKKVILRKIQLSYTDIGNLSSFDGQLRINNQKIRTSELGQTTLKQTDLFHQGIGSLCVEGATNTSTVFVKIPHVKWQVRNGIADFKGDSISIEGLRSDFQQKPEIIIIPTEYKENYVAKLLDIDKCLINYGNNDITVTLGKNPSKDATMVLKCMQPIKRVSGGEVVKYEDNMLIVNITSKHTYLKF